MEDNIVSEEVTILHGLIINSFKRFSLETAVVWASACREQHESNKNGPSLSSVLSYAQLQESILELSEELQTHGVRNSVVALLWYPHIYLPTMLLSILHCSSAFYPVSLDGVRYTRDGLVKTSASWLLCPSNLFKNAEQLLTGLSWTRMDSAILTKYHIHLLRLSKCQSPLVERFHLAYCITTSGTTSTPKVVRVPHACIVPNILHLSRLFEVTSKDTVLLSSPLTFDPSIVDIFITLASGACLLLVSDTVKQVPDKLLDIIHKRYPVTILQATPTLVRRFSPAKLQQTILGPESQLRVLALGGEAFPGAYELRSWLHPSNKTLFFNLYGITEVSVWASYVLVNKESYLHQDDTAMSIGAPLDSTQVKVADHKGNKVYCGKEGYIWIGSSHRKCLVDDEGERNSISDEGSTAERDKVVWRNSGDRGVLNANGAIVYCGRHDNEVKRHGKRMNLGIVEQVCNELTWVVDCRALLDCDQLLVFLVAPGLENRREVANAREHNHTISTHCPVSGMFGTHSSKPEISGTSDGSQSDNRHEEIVIKNAGSLIPLSEMVVEEVVMHVRNVLPSQYQPDQIVGVDVLPMTAHGKLDRRTLLKLASMAQTIPNVMIENLKVWLQQVWLAHLPAGISLISDTDTFVSLGGDSLASVRLVNSLKSYFGEEVPTLLDFLINKPFACFVQQIQQCMKGFLKNRGNTDNSLIKPWEDIDNSVCTSERERLELVRTEDKMHSWNILKKKRILDEEVRKRSKRSRNESDAETIESSLETHHKSETDIDYQSSDFRTNLISAAQRVEPKTKLCHWPKIPEADERIVKVEIKKKGNDTADNMQVPVLLVSRGNGIVFCNSDDSDVQCMNEHDKTQCMMPNLAGRYASKPFTEEEGKQISDFCTSSIESKEKLSSSLQTSSEAGDRKCITSQGLDADAGEVEEKGQPVLKLKLRWKFDTSKCVDASPMAVVYRARNQTVVFIGSHSGLFSAVDVVSGVALWSVVLPDRIESSACSSLHGDMVVVGCYDGCIYVLDSSTGQQLWSVATGEMVKSSPVLDLHTGRVICGSHDGQLYCLDIEKQERVWETHLGGGSVFSTSAVDAVKRVVYAACLAGNLVAVHADTGSPVWSLSLNKPLFSSPWTMDSSVLIGCVDGQLYCVNVDGQMEWTFETGGPIFSSPVAVDNHTVLVGSHDHHLYCINCNGQLRWKLEMPGTVYSTVFLCNIKPFAKVLEVKEKEKSISCLRIGSLPDDASDSSFIENVDQNVCLSKTRLAALNQTVTNEKFAQIDLVISSSTDGTLHCLCQDTGQMLCCEKLPGQVFSSPIVVGSSILIGCRDNFLYCYKIILEKSSGS